ncbi:MULTISPECIES: ATP-binding protein [unclassified Sphingomonas]|uniref:sensor histidine kinase n=1 Tax=unclassified Sphingomonas TaxID=196159 RepID=UPI00226ACD99|nr:MULTISPECIES: ATP-binding protein [unclassified Sphingomonas]
MQRFWEAIDRDERTSPPPFRYVQCIALGLSALAATMILATVISVRLPYLFCIAAVMVAAFRGGLLASAMTTIIALGGTTLLAHAADPIVTLRSTAVVTIFCLAMGAAGEALIRSRRQERAVTDQALRREQTLQIIFHESPAITILVDPDGRIAAANNAAIKLLSLSDRTFVASSVAAFFGSVPFPHDGGRVTPVIGGRSLSLDLSFADLPIAGRAYRLLYVRDESEAKAAADGLALTQRELHRIARATSLGQLGSSIAHELNQPLSFAANYAGVARAMLDAPIPDTPAIKDVVDQSLKQIFRTATMLKRLRAFVGRRSPKLEWISVGTVVAEAKSIADLAIKEAHANFTTEVEDPERMVFVDAVMIQQVILNLVANAADAVRDLERRQIRLMTTQTRPEELAITIDDSGEGIPEDLRDDVFAPFRSSKADGVGIGLAICRTIVEAHGGRISASSPGALGGAGFRFTLVCKA